MNAKLDLRRIGIFTAVAFGLAWTIALIIYLNGGLGPNSPELIPGSGITLALALLAVGYMGAPAVAHVVTRWVTREGWRSSPNGPMLRPNFRRGWRFYLAAWFLPGLLTIIGGLAYFLIFPAHYSTATIDQASALTGGLNPWLFVAIQTLFAMLIAPLINSLFTFGEEFGWRGYLLPRLMPLGAPRAMLVLGVIWGVWHWPVIAMGHNYGLNYPGYPWTGMLMMVWMTVGLSFFTGWVTLRSGSVWTAVIAHAAINGIAGLPLLFVNPQAMYTLLGPSPAGLIGSLGYAALTVALLLNPRALRPLEQPQRPAEPGSHPSTPTGEPVQG